MELKEDDIEKEKAITKRIITKEENITILTSKYLDLMKKINISTRDEIKNILDEILNEIDLIEINTYKAKNIENLKEKEKKIYLGQKDIINNNIKNTKDEISQKKKELNDEKNNRNKLIKCEEIAKEINKFDSPSRLNEKIEKVKKDNENLIKNKNELDEKLKFGEDKINIIMNLLSELKKSFPNN